MLQWGGPEAKEIAKALRRTHRFSLSSPLSRDFKEEKEAQTSAPLLCLLLWTRCLWLHSGWVRVRLPGDRSERGLGVSGRFYLSSLCLFSRNTDYVCAGSPLPVPRADTSSGVMFQPWLPNLPFRPSPSLLSVCAVPCDQSPSYPLCRLRGGSGTDWAFSIPHLSRTSPALYLVTSDLSSCISLFVFQ